MYLQYILCYGYVLCVFGFFIVCVSVCECVCAYMTHHTRESQKTLLFWSKFSFFCHVGPWDGTLTTGLAWVLPTFETILIKEFLH